MNLLVVFPFPPSPPFPSLSSLLPLPSSSRSPPSSSPLSSNRPQSAGAQLTSSQTEMICARKEKETQTNKKINEIAPPPPPKKNPAIKTKRKGQMQGTQTRQEDHRLIDTPTHRHRYTPTHRHRQTHTDTGRHTQTQADTHRRRHTQTHANTHTHTRAAGSSDLAVLIVTVYVMTAGG